MYNPAFSHLDDSHALEALPADPRLPARPASCLPLIFQDYSSYGIYIRTDDSVEMLKVFWGSDFY